MEGGELFNRIRQKQDKPYTEREAAHVILMIGKAVHHLHHMDMVGYEKKKKKSFNEFIVVFLLGSS